MHRLYGFGGCNIDPWLQFYKDNMRDVCQYLLTLPQDELDAFEQMIDEAFDNISVTELLKVIKLETSLTRLFLKFKYNCPSL